MFDMMILFVRNEMVRPAVGRSDAGRFLPLILTYFFFILFCNLLGLVPWLGSPTASAQRHRPLGGDGVSGGHRLGHGEVRPIRFWAGFARRWTFRSC